MTTATLPTVWIVDDDATVRDILAIALVDDFTIKLASSGEEILQRLLDEHSAGRPEPALVLLDIEMDLLDGYQTCRRLRDAGLTMPVIFVSAHDSLEERLQAFDAGGDDFIGKPFDPELVLVKAQKTVAHHKQASVHAEEKRLLQETALGILREVGETGVLLDFLRDALRITDHATLARELIRTAEDYGIRCHVQIRTPDGPLSLTPDGEPTALEQSILEHATKMGREFRIGRRLILNFDHVSLMVLNMPRDEAVSLRHTSYLEVLVESAQAMAETIDMRRESAARAEALMVASNESFCTLEDLRDGYRKQQVDTRLLLHDMIEEVEKSFVHLGLTDGQEITISATIRNNAEKILDLFELGVNFDRQFAAVLESMKPKQSGTPEVWI